MCDEMCGLRTPFDAGIELKPDGMWNPLTEAKWQCQTTLIRQSCLEQVAGAAPEDI